MGFGLGRPRAYCHWYCHGLCAGGCAESGCDGQTFEFAAQFVDLHLVVGAEAELDRLVAHEPHPERRVGCVAAQGGVEAGADAGAAVDRPRASHRPMPAHSASSFSQRSSALDTRNTLSAFRTGPRPFGACLRALC